MRMPGHQSQRCFSKALLVLIVFENIIFVVDFWSEYVRCTCGQICKIRRWLKENRTIEELAIRLKLEDRQASKHGVSLPNLNILPWPAISETVCS